MFPCLLPDYLSVLSLTGPSIFTQGNIIVLRCFELQWDHCLCSGLFLSLGGGAGGEWVGVSCPPEATSTSYMLVFATNHFHPFTGEVTVMSSR